MADVISTVWLVQDRLYAALLARQALPDNPLATPEKVTITLGGPGAYEREHVWIAGEVERWPIAYNVSGLETKDETYSLRVHVLVTRHGNAYVDARDRARDLVGEVERTLSSDVFLGGCPVHLAQVSHLQVEEAIPTEHERQVLITAWVQIRALAGMDG